MKINVAFADESEKTITASFGCAQDIEVWPNQMAIPDTDARWSAYLATLSPDIRALLLDTLPA